MEEIPSKMIKKKKIRQKHQPDPGGDAPLNSSDEENVPETTKFCPHVTKSVSVVSLKKAFKSKVCFGQCQVCSKTTTNEVGKENEDEEFDDSSWLCLQCGYQGCSQQSSCKHALQHYNTPHSDSHALVLNTTSWAIWCYKCDDEVSPDTSRFLANSVDLVKKQAGVLSKASPSLPSPSSSSCFGKSQSESVEEPILDQPAKAPDQLAKKIEKVSPTEEKKKLNGLVVTIQQIQVKGLVNLVNTCFFNAVLQNLSQVPCFLTALEGHCKSDISWDVQVPAELQSDFEGESISINLSPSGSLTQALINLLRDMNSSSQDKKGVINPMALFKQVCEKAPQFKNQQQQDSHELLRCLLDGVRTEEVKRQKRAILKLFDLTEKVNPDHVKEDTKAKLKTFAKNASYTIVDKVFGGQLVSTVFCEECQMSSQVFEPFMDLSLPVSEEKRVRPGLQKRSSEDAVDCFGRGPANKRNDEGLSKYQEKKQKRQNKKEAKKQAKAEKNAKKSLPTSPTTDSLAKSEDNGEDEGSEADVNDADIEDNEDDTTSQDSMTATKSHANEVDSQTASGSTNINELTVEADSDLSRTLSSSEMTIIGSDPDPDSIKEENALCIAVKDLTVNEESSESKDSLLEQTEDVNLSAIKETIKENYLGSTDSGFGTGEVDAALPSKSLKQEWLSKSWTSMAPRYVSASHECSVLSCLNLFTLPELLMGKNKFGCENCSKLKAEKEGLEDEEKFPMVYTNATKQLLIFSPPAVLTLHLKRFQQSGMSLTKVNRFIEFPLVLDLAPFCSSIALGLPHMRTGQDKILYSLCGVVEHSGKLTGGHYTAFIRVKNQARSLDLLSFLNNAPISQMEIDSLLEEFMKKRKFVVPSCKTEEVVSEIAEVTGKWYHISDTNVNEVNESTVLRCQAYLLFYERIF